MFGAQLEIKHMSQVLALGVCLIHVTQLTDLVVWACLLFYVCSNLLWPLELSYYVISAALTKILGPTMILCDERKEQVL